MARITAKAQVVSKLEQGTGEHRNVVVSFNAGPYVEGKNADWAKWTPALSLSMTMRGEVADAFSIGSEWTLTFNQEFEA